MTKEPDSKATASAKRHLLEQLPRLGSPFGAHPASVTVKEGVDLIRPMLDVVSDAEPVLEVDPSRR